MTMCGSHVKENVRNINFMTANWENVKFCCTSKYLKVVCKISASVQGKCFTNYFKIGSWIIVPPADECCSFKETQFVMTVQLQ